MSGLTSSWGYPGWFHRERHGCLLPGCTNRGITSRKCGRRSSLVAFLQPGTHVNQVERLLYVLRHEHFAFVEVCELLLRITSRRPPDYVPRPDGGPYRLLTFGRRIEPSIDEGRGCCSRSRAGLLNLTARLEVSEPPIEPNPPPGSMKRKTP